jgi:hypothetical protein
MNIYDCVQFLLYIRFHSAQGHRQGVGVRERSPFLEKSLKLTVISTGPSLILLVTGRYWYLKKKCFRPFQCFYMYMYAPVLYVLYYSMYFILILSHVTRVIRRNKVFVFRYTEKIF